jgi:signal transduction histidine kinase
VLVPRRPALAVAGRLAALLIRAGEVGRRVPLLADSLVAALVAASATAAMFMPSHGPAERAYVHIPLVWAIVMVAGQAAPLIWLRSAPTVVAAVVLAANLGQWAVGWTGPGTFGLLIALYSVARHERLRRLHWVATACAAALLVPAFTIAPFDQQAWTSLFLLWCGITAASALGVVARVRADRFEALRERAARLEVEREQRAQLATLAERARVSREMHDIVGHHLAVMIGLADSAGFAGEQTPEMLRLIGDTGREALVELRRTLGRMRAHPVGRDALDARSLELSPQPGLSDIAGLCERLRSAGPAVDYRLTGEIGPVPAGVQLAAYRIVQEALTNTLKHAGSATTVSVAVHVIEHELSVEVRDTGQGMLGPRLKAQGSPGTPAPASYEGLGLGGITERATLTGGSASAGPIPGGEGWLVSAVLPLAASLVARQEIR